MGYRRALLVRWSRRDRLAVVVVAVTVAFLTGTTLLLFAASGQTAAIAADFDSPATARFEGPTPDAPPGATVVPLAAVTVDGERAVVAGVPDGAPELSRGVTLAGEPGGTTLGTADAAVERRLVGEDASVTLRVRPRVPGSAAIPPSWYATEPATVERLGVTGSLVVRSGESAGGVPLLSALRFFLAGTREAVTALGVAVAVGGVLVGVTVHGVTRMSVRDRLADVRVIRATGATPRQVLGTFALRAVLQTAVGVALGYAVGVVATSAAVNAAVALGVPTALPVRVSTQALGVLAPAYLALVAVAGVAGLAAAWPAVRTPPARLTDAHVPEGVGGYGGRFGALREWSAPTLLSTRAVVPTAATLTAFVVVAALVAGTAGVLGPLAGTGGATVTEPGSPHPIASQVPADYAAALRADGVNASAEILLFGVVDGQPFFARGAQFEAFAKVSDARLVAGRTPGGPHEAVVGEDLARTLGVDVGDRLPLGGSTRPAVTRVRVVGVFEAPGPFDDQLVVPLSTARHLSTVPSGMVNFVRLERLPDADADPTAVVDVSAPDTVRTGRQFTARVTVRNAAPDSQNATVTVRYRGQRRRVGLRVPSRDGVTATVEFDAGDPGRGTLRAGNVSRTVRVVRPDALFVRGLPARGPPGSEPRLRVVNATGGPVADARVTVGNRTATTDADGYARVVLRETGTRTVTVRAGDRRTTATVDVARGATRAMAASLRVAPSHPGVLVRPTAELRLSNPWNRTLARNVTLAGPVQSTSRTVRLAPGDTTTVSLSLARRPAGTYAVEASADGRRLAGAEYRVTGDERLASALASGGRAGSSGIGRAAQVAFGNVGVVVALLLGLAALMTVGATTATFAREVHARRRALGVHRATGASPFGLVRLVLGDALRLGVPAAMLATVMGLTATTLLSRLGALVLFGVRVDPTPPLAVVLATTLGAILLATVAAAVAAVGLLGASPARLLAGERTATPGGENRE